MYMRPLLAYMYLFTTFLSVFSRRPARLHPPPSPFSSECCTNTCVLSPLPVIFPVPGYPGSYEIYKRPPTALLPRYHELDLRSTQGLIIDTIELAKSVAVL